MLSDDFFMLLLYPDPSGPVQLIRVDLQTRDSAVVLKVELEPCKDVQPCIQGQFICGSVRLPGSGDVYVLLFNWVKSQYMLFRLKMAHRVSLALVPGHLLISVEEPIAPGRQLLLFFSLDDLRSHWRPINESHIHYDDSVNVFDHIYVFGRYPAVQTWVDEEEAWSHRRWQLRVLEDALHRGSYRILVYASDIIPNGTRRTSGYRASLYSFRLSLDRLSVVGWKRLSMVPAVSGVLKFTQILTYSGYCFAPIRNTVRVVLLRLEDGETAEQGKVDGMFADLQSINEVSVALNGAVVTFGKPTVVQGPRPVVVSYYS
ncbi:hypothetical protein B0H19DRAFT_1239469 [Mycena capillaripes]|nr:hypothetical protein B0H19DRAFT_1239469 [Mycena capillaripes]